MCFNLSSQKIVLIYLVIDTGNKETRSLMALNWKISPSLSIPVKFYSLVMPVKVIPSHKIFWP